MRYPLAKTNRDDTYNYKKKSKGNELVLGNVDKSRRLFGAKRNNSACPFVVGGRRRAYSLEHAGSFAFPLNQQGEPKSKHIRVVIKNLLNAHVFLHLIPGF